MKLPGVKVYYFNWRKEAIIEKRRKEEITTLLKQKINPNVQVIANEK